MKKILIGKHGIGKTIFLIKEIIPTIEKYLVLDFCDEYSQWIKDDTKIRKFERELIGDKLKQQVINIIRNTKDDTTLIIDNANLMYAPQKIDSGFLWLREELINKNYILVFQSIRSITDGEVLDIFDDIHYFPTNDSDNVRTNYLDFQRKKGNNVMIMGNFNIFL